MNSIECNQATEKDTKEKKKSHSKSHYTEITIVNITAMQGDPKHLLGMRLPLFRMHGLRSSIISISWFH